MMLKITISTIVVLHLSIIWTGCCAKDKNPNTEINIKGKYDKGSAESFAVGTCSGIKDTDEVKRMDIYAKNNERNIDISVPAYSIAAYCFKI